MNEAVLLSKEALLIYIGFIGGILPFHFFGSGIRKLKGNMRFLVFVGLGILGGYLISIFNGEMWLIFAGGLLGAFLERKWSFSIPKLRRAG